jgi:hypothetical protein
MVEYIYDLLKKSFSPQPRVNLSLEWATQSSRDWLLENYNASSSYTACVLDVAVGYYDICVADIWHTSQREAMVQFLPFLYIDSMLLLVRKSPDEGTDFLEYLKAPFRPFQWESWYCIFAFLMFTGFVLFFTEYFESNPDFPYPLKGFRLMRIGRALYLACGGFLITELEIEAPTLPSKVVKLGFGFFALITISSYTANLATLLVIDAEKQEIQGISDVIERRLKVCSPTHDRLGDSLNALYPGLQGVVQTSVYSGMDYDGRLQNTWRLAHNGDCDVVIIDDKNWLRAAKGEYAALDCERLANGELSEHVAHCLKADDGRVDLTRECKRFTQIGESLMSLPVAFPVSDRVAKPLRRVLAHERSLGSWEIRQRSWEERRFASACTTMDLDNQPEGMPLSSMVGTIFFSTVVMVFALSLSLVERIKGRHITEMLGYKLSTDTEVPRTTMSFASLEKELAEVEKDLGIESTVLLGNNPNADNGAPVVDKQLG